MISEFQTEIANYAKIIERFDELIGDKVSKFEHQKVLEKIKELIVQEEFEYHLGKQEEKIKNFELDINSIKQKMIGKNLKIKLHRI